MRTTTEVWIGRVAGRSVPKIIGWGIEHKSSQTELKKVA